MRPLTLVMGLWAVTAGLLAQTSCAPASVEGGDAATDRGGSVDTDPPEERITPVPLDRRAPATPRRAGSAPDLDGDVAYEPAADWI